MRQAVRSERGMTLVEVMVSAVVLSMVMLALAASLRTFANTFESVDRSVNRISQLREATYFLRHVIREAYFPRTGAFFASSDEVVWLAPLDRAGAAGGVFWLRLREDAGRLMLDFAKPEADEEEMAEDNLLWGKDIESEVLLRGLERLRVDALPDAQSEWGAEAGLMTDGLPMALRLTLELSDAAWPDITIALDGYQDR